jgi:hypothetical protein
MNFINGIIAKFAGYVNDTSTANGAWRLRTVLRDATSNLGYVPGYLAAPGAVVLGRSEAVHCPLFVAPASTCQHCHNAPALLRDAQPYKALMQPKWVRTRLRGHYCTVFCYCHLQGSVY